MRSNRHRTGSRWNNGRHEKWCRANTNLTASLIWSVSAKLLCPWNGRSEAIRKRGSPLPWNSTGAQLEAGSARLGPALTLSTAAVGTALNPGWTLTQTRCAATATFVGLFPNGIVVTASVLESIRARVPFPAFATQTAPEPVEQHLRRG